MAKAKITFFVDIVSPFAYLGFYALRNFPAFRPVDVTFVPVFLGGIMKTTGNTPPINIKNKDKWINVERLRWAKLFNVPMAETLPSGFPPMTLALQRCLAALELSHPEKMADVIEALFKDFWEKGNAEINKVEVFKPVIAGVVGLDAAEDIVVRSGGKEAKARLQENGDKALQTGAFGLPWFWCENENEEKEGFWGFDHIGQVCNFLGLERIENKGWKAML